jgi:hypothetical protein
MLAEFRLEDFLPHVGTDFRLATPAGATITARLSTAVPLADHRRETPVGSRAPFSLVFLAPPEPILPQGTWTVLHPEMPEVAYFFVPLGPDEEGLMRYQAIFN